MSDYIIRVENLGKKYRIRHQPEQQRYVALRDVIASGVKGVGSSVFLGVRSWVPSLGLNSNGLIRPKHDPKSKFQNPVPNIQHLTPNTEDFWALKDVNFEVKQGEVVGIIGRNGAGKSTLLKILSRITKPTEGRVCIRGRVASLLEVGTGFHPELTGRENVFLNGAILGMTREDIKRKFDEIVAFAEAEKFLDTPVKRYSSGMYVRLAFAVAAHLEPDILVVDEILAVGDAEFQKKCLRKLESAAKNKGRAVLFVSHNMAPILALCTSAALLRRGMIEAVGQVKDVVEQYSRLISDVADSLLSERSDRAGDGMLRIYRVRLLDSVFREVRTAFSGQKLTFALDYSSNRDRPLRNVHFAIGVHSRLDEHLFHLATNTSGDDLKEIPVSGSILCHIKSLPLQAGTYTFNLYCMVNGEIADWVRNAGTVEVAPGNFFGTGRLPPSEQGAFLVEHSWSLML
jgi:lipopolysaccharide transport system ATP-binding protein